MADQNTTFTPDKTNKQRALTKDLTNGNPMSLILGFSVPLLFGMLFQQFYSLVDTIIVGKCIDANALAAVGSTGSINFLIIGFCIGICSGFSIPVAQRFGAGDHAGMRKMVWSGAWLSLVFAVIMTVVVSLFCGQILRAMHTPDDIYEQAYSYIFVIFLGIPVIYLYNMLSGIIRSLGDSKTPVIFLVLSSVLNIVLDLLFILVFDLNVAGAAYATVLSQLVSGIACLVFMIRRFPILRPENKHELLYDAHCGKILCNMGIPMGLQYSITAIGSVILQTAVNNLGTTAVAAVTAGNRLGNFLVCPFDAMGSTMATYGGQNIGAKKTDRIKEGLKACTLLGAAYSAIALLFILLCGRTLLLLFLNATETGIITMAYRFLCINSLFYFPLALVNIIRFLIQGMGYSRFAMLAGVCEMAARALVGFCIVPAFGFYAVGFASPAAWIFADAFLIPAFFHVYHKTQKLFSEF
ncbi:MAG: MATE family efflux transporter [Clostridium sp.]|nr:MATE family efflux transporter [Clostridium sp.]